jgi:large subunit ribosomal protein L15
MGRYEIRPAEESRQPRKRLGRGPGSGLGKTAGKGHKGQKARSGYKSKPGFEGGQMPLQRRVPKRGFKNPFRRSFQVVNLADLQKLEAAAVDQSALAAAGLVRSARQPVKILGGGEISRRIKVTADAFSENARRAIEAAGGSCSVGRPAGTGEDASAAGAGQV